VRRFLRGDFELGERMAPQVGLEPDRQIPTAETSALKFIKNTSKTSADAGRHGRQSIV
jgi:hypothetical protein